MLRRPEHNRHPGNIEGQRSSRPNRSRESWQLTDAIAEVSRWHASEGLIMSNRAYEQLLGLREAVHRYLHEPAGSDHLEELTDDIWARGGQFRASQ